MQKTEVTKRMIVSEKKTFPFVFLLSLMLFLVAFKASSQNESKYIYNLHGRIIEIQGKDAISDEYGEYEFDSIVNSFSDLGHKVIAEVRTENVDYIEYANKISSEIDSLVILGVK